MQPNLTIIRGLPGSGKSTRAKELMQEKRNNGRKVSNLESDMFFMFNNKYIFNKNHLNYSHLWCLSNAAYYLNQGYDVIVSNTFVTKDEIFPYNKMAAAIDINDISIITCFGKFRNIHNVPIKVIEHMKEKWEDFNQEEYSNYLIKKMKEEI